MPEPTSDRDLTGLGRRQVLIMGGAALGLGALSSLAGAGIAFAVTIADPWVDQIASYNWDWMGHRNNGYTGGQDYAYAYGQAIYAPAAGTLGTGNAGTGLVRFTLDSTVSRLVTAEAGESGDTLAAIEFMHFSDFGTPGHYSAGGGPVGYVGNAGLGKSGTAGAHLHVHGISTNGSRVDWRKFGSGSGPVQVINLGSSRMTTRYQKIGTGSPPGQAGTVLALAGDLGYPGPGNWREYTRANIGYPEDRAATEWAAHGVAVLVPAAEWDTLKAFYTTGTPANSVPQTVNLSDADRALLVDIATKLDALGA